MGLGNWPQTHHSARRYNVTIREDVRQYELGTNALHIEELMHETVLFIMMTRMAEREGETWGRGDNW